LCSIRRGHSWPRACTTRKKLAIPLLISSIILFYLGAAFAYYVVFPVMLSFFVATTPPGVQMMTDMGSYLDFVMVLLLAFGLAFEVPVATVLLSGPAFVKIKALKKNRGFVLLGIFIFAAFVTPPDAVSQSAMAVPMYFALRNRDHHGRTAAQRENSGARKRGS